MASCASPQPPSTSAETDILVPKPQIEATLSKSAGRQTKAEAHNLRRGLSFTPLRFCAQPSTRQGESGTWTSSSGYREKRVRGLYGRRSPRANFIFQPPRRRHTSGTRVDILAHDRKRSVISGHFQKAGAAKSLPSNVDKIDAGKARNSTGYLSSLLDLHKRAAGFFWCVR